MKKIFPTVLAIIVPLFLMGLFAKAAVAGEVPRMTKDELKAMLGNPDVVIIDVRTGMDWKASESKIKTAVREKPKKANSWGSKYDKNKTYVLYCA